METSIQRKLARYTSIIDAIVKLNHNRTAYDLLQKVTWSLFATHLRFYSSWMLKKSRGNEWTEFQDGAHLLDPVLSSEHGKSWYDPTGYTEIRTASFEAFPVMFAPVTINSEIFKRHAFTSFWPFAIQNTIQMTSAIRGIIAEWGWGQERKGMSSKRDKRAQSILE